MRRTTISLPEDLAWCLEREAKQKDSSRSEVVRQVLAKHFEIVPGKRHIPFAGIGHGDGSNVSGRFDEILAETWADHIANDRDP